MHDFIILRFSKLLRVVIPLFFSISCSNSVESAATGKVVAIADGDTFTLLDANHQQIKIRLHGIDCPERGQEFGSVARQKLSELIFGQPVKLIEKDTDRYGRIVAIAYNKNNACINEEMLKSGLAWHYREYDDNPEWVQLEERARTNKVGLWSQPNPTPPWEWRKQKREKQTINNKNP